METVPALERLEQLLVEGRISREDFVLIARELRQPAVNQQELEAPAGAPPAVLRRVAFNALLQWLVLSALPFFLVLTLGRATGADGLTAANILLFFSYTGVTVIAAHLIGVSMGELAFRLFRHRWPVSRRTAYVSACWAALLLLLPGLILSE